MSVRYIALACSIVGSPENWSDSWYWDGTSWPTLDEAIEHGFKTYDRSDDFNWGTIGKDGRLCHIGWMYEEREQDADELREANRDHELSRWVPAYRQTRWDQAATEATSSTSLDQPEGGAGYTAVEPHCRCTDPACTKVTHYYGVPVPAPSAGPVLGSQVPAGPVLGEEAVRAEAVRILDSYFRLTLRIDLDEDIPAAAEEIAEMVAAAEQRGAEKWKGIAERGQATVRRVAGLLDAFDGFAHDGDEAEDATDCPRCIVDAFTAALDGSR